MPFDFYEGGPYIEQGSKPEDLLQYKIGERQTAYAQMETIVKAIAKPRPTAFGCLKSGGRTNEYGMQYLVAVSSSENIARL